MVGWVVGGRQQRKRTKRRGHKGPRTKRPGSGSQRLRDTAGRRCGACAFNMGAGGRRAAALSTNYSKACYFYNNYSCSEYTTTSFNEYYILDYYLSRSCANNCYLILRNRGQTQDFLSLLETTLYFSTPSQKTTLTSAPLLEATEDLPKGKICPNSCGIFNRDDNTQHMLTGHAEKF